MVLSKTDSGQLYDNPMRTQLRLCKVRLAYGKREWSQKESGAEQTLKIDRWVTALRKLRLSFQTVSFQVVLL